MPRILRALLLAFTATLALATPASAALVINEIDYDQPSTDTAEFLEIANTGTEPVELGTYSVRLINGGVTPAAQYRSFALPAGNLAAGDHFVVCGNGANVANCDLDVTPDSDLIQNGAPDAATLVNGDTTVDSVSYEGEMDGYTEGAAGAPADTGVGTQSISRVPDGCDTNQNGTDFVVAPSTPGAANGASCGGDEPAVASTDPANGADEVDRDTNITVTFNEPVTAGDDAFALACDGADVPLAVSGDGTTFTLDPAEQLPRDARCTLTVEADAVTDADGNHPTTDSSTSFTTDSSVAGLRIHDIQGASHISPYRGALALAVPGVVTARRTNGYFIQDPRPDRDSRTSEGIFVFTSTAPDAALTPGTAVTVTGRVTEFRAGGADSANLTVTELTSATALPAPATGPIAPTLVGKGGRVPPTTVIEDDVVDPGGEDPTAISGDVEQGDPLFDPQEDGIDFYESLEGMLTEIRNAVVVGPTSVFSSGLPTENRELPVLADGGAGASVRADRGPILVRGFDQSAPQEYRRGDLNPERITLNDTNDPNGTFLPLADVRDRFTAPVRAVVDYSFGAYKFLALNNPKLADGKLKPETTRKKQRDELAVASYNVENLDGLDPQARYDRVASQIVGNLRAPDILSLEEIQDNDGAASAAPTSADVTYTRLIKAIVRRGRAALRLPAGRPGPAQRRRRAERQHPRRLPVPHRRARPRVRRPRDRDGDHADHAGRRPGRHGAADAQPRPRRPDEHGVQQQPQAARGRVPLPRQAAVHRRQPLRLQGRRRPGLRALPGAAAVERGAAPRQRDERGRGPRPGRRGQHVRAPDPRHRLTRARCRARRPQRLRVLGDGEGAPARRRREGARARGPVALRPAGRALQLRLPGQRPGPRPHPRQPGAAVPRRARTSTRCTSTPSSQDQASDHDPPISRFDVGR